MMLSKRKLLREINELFSNIYIIDEKINKLEDKIEKQQILINQLLDYLGIHAKVVYIDVSSVSTDAAYKAPVYLFAKKEEFENDANQD
jgi:hypothetical protein